MKLLMHFVVVVRSAMKGSNKDAASLQTLTSSLVAVKALQ